MTLTEVKNLLKTDGINSKKLILEALEGTCSKKHIDCLVELRNSLTIEINELIAEANEKGVA